MNLGRVWAIFLRYFYSFAKLDQLADLFYWPAIDILLWGMTSVWMQGKQGIVSDTVLMILTGLIFWQVIWRSTYEISVNLLQEFWNRNLVNLFSTPLKISEWMVATMLIGVLKIFVSLAFGGLLVWILYALNVFSMGWAFIPFCVSLTLSGWLIGYLASSVLVYYGQRLQMLAWMAPFMIAPFSAVYYPVSVLPQWAQMIAYALPTTYIFEGMRKVLFEQEFSLFMLFMSLGLNILYLSGAIWLFKYMFEKSRSKGLSRLE